MNKVRNREVESAIMPKTKCFYYRNKNFYAAYKNRFFSSDKTNFIFGIKSVFMPANKKFYGLKIFMTAKKIISHYSANEFECRYLYLFIV